MTVTKFTYLCLSAILCAANLIHCEQYCLSCKNALTISECTKSVRCAADQYCFTEEVVSSGGIIYNAGCKSPGACSHIVPSGGRRNSDVSVTCSKCCKNETAHNCNEKFCGLLGTTSIEPRDLAHCYQCDRRIVPADCNDLVICQADEMCGVNIQIKSGGFLDGVQEFTFGCLNKSVCLEITQRMLYYWKMSATSSGLGRRADLDKCEICCGGNYCNTGDCYKLTEKLFKLYMNGHLNFNTLQYLP